MAHRGRLNVLVNNLGKVPADLFSEFEGKKAAELAAGRREVPPGLLLGHPDRRAATVHLTLAFNPSHLEIVNPVVEGSVRARQHRRGDLKGDQVLPLLIHGDAAFAGQGVVMETLALSQTRGYKTGGTVHVVVNNQIGFTTSDTRDSALLALLHGHRQDGRGARLPRERRRPRGRGDGGARSPSTTARSSTRTS